MMIYMSMQRILRAPAITLHTMADHLAMSNARCGPPQGGGKPHGDKSGQREGGPENRFLRTSLKGSFWKVTNEKDRRIWQNR